PRYTIYRVSVALIGEPEVSTEGIPDLHCSCGGIKIERAGGDTPAIRGPRYARHLNLVPSIDEQAAPIASIPDLCCSLKVTRGDTLAIGGPRYTVYITSMALIGELKTATAGIPDLYCHIGRAGGDTLAIGGPRYTVYTMGDMAPIGEQAAPIAS